MGLLGAERRRLFRLTAILGAVSRAEAIRGARLKAERNFRRVENEEGSEALHQLRKRGCIK
jgi:hypothetical protein